MTAQFSEKLFYKGKKHSMCNEPLAMYFALGGTEPEFEVNCTALWRGYIGTWEIVDDRLYMVGLKGKLVSGTEANLGTIFPGNPNRVFAHWYSGKVRLPQGKLLEYVHMGYGSVYEKDLFLYFENGAIKKSEIVKNGEASDTDAREGYGIGAMTEFPLNATDADRGEA